MQIKLLMTVLLAILLSKFAFADQGYNSKNSFENTQEVIQHLKLQEVGQATFSVFFWDIYKSKLQTTSGSYPLQTSNDSLLYQIEYLMDITSNDLIEKTVEQWQHIGVPEHHYQAYLPQLEGLWPDINKRDSLALLIHNQRSVFYYNGNYLGEITDPWFGSNFLAIWLSEKTSQPKLRRQLLKGISNE
jgi:hypothetical protein